MRLFRHVKIRLFLLVLFSSLISCSSSSSSPTWTILVYMDAGNDLAAAANTDLLEMRAVGSTDKVRIVVQLSLPDANDSAKVTTKRLLVHKDSIETLSELGNVSLADPQAMTGFLLWAMDAYPADRNVLVLWDHGNGWDQGDAPSQPSPKLKSIFLDNVNPHFVPNHEIRKAIQASSVRLDVLGMDACTMSTIETLYEFRDVAPIIISSEEETEAHGWDYYALLASLVNSPEMGIEDFARSAVQSYGNFYENSFYPAQPAAYDRRYTLSAIRTSYLPVLVQEIDRLAGNLIAHLNDPATQSETISLITSARGNVQAIDRYIQPDVYVDLLDLDSRLGQTTDIASFTSAATIAEYHGSGRPNAHGISIVFFPSRQSLTYDPNYKNYDPQTNTGNGGDFINEFRWDEFLKTYYDSAGL